jgi:hypothetical protein
MSEEVDKLVEQMQGIANKIREEAPLSVLVLGDLVREKMLAEGFPENPSFQDMLGNATLIRWSSIIAKTGNPEEQDRLAREWIEEFDSAE